MERHALYLWFGLTALPCLSAPTAHGLNPALLDARFPDMAQWVLAGVEPSALKSGSPTTLHLAPDADLAAAVSVPNRLILLAAGTYPITRTLRFAPGVVLRGAGAPLTKLVVKLRGPVPAPAAAGAFPAWTTGLLLHSVDRCGIENLTVSFDDSLPPPPDPRLGPAGSDNDSDDRADLHVVLVRMTDSQNCWMTDCSLQNSGDHPLLLEASRHISIENTKIAGTYHKSPNAGSLNIVGSEYCLFDGLTVDDVSHVYLHEGSPGRPCRYNVIVNSRINVDVRFSEPGTSRNLLQSCVIAVPAWLNFPPISLGTDGDREHPPGGGNLVFLCTATRDFSSAQRSFSIADNPGRVYRVRTQFTTGATVEDAGPAPAADTLWPVR
ncbi:MAG: hypothetical protein ACHQ4G_04050 [Opitutales bacterium]